MTPVLLYFFLYSFSFFPSFSFNVLLFVSICFSFLCVTLRASCHVTQHSLCSSSFILFALIYRSLFFLLLKRASVRVTVNLSCFDGVLFEKETEIVLWVGVMDVVHALWPGKVTEAYDRLFTEILLLIIHVFPFKQRGQWLVGLHGRWKMTL